MMYCTVCVDVDARVESPYTQQIIHVFLHHLIKDRLSLVA